FENQDYLFEDLATALEHDPAPGRNPLFDVMLTLQNIESDTGHLRHAETGNTAPVPQMTLKERPGREISTAKFDLMVTAVETTDGQIRIKLGYATQLFKEETIVRYAGYFHEILEAVKGDRDIRLQDIAISTELKRVETENPEMDLDF
ncbi:MAG: hypothetical protein GY765_09015, partial [bacterium]|nr:hypothetical protein [bacterium]